MDLDFSYVKLQDGVAGFWDQGSRLQWVGAGLRV